MPRDKKRRRRQLPNDFFKKPQMASWLFAAPFIFDRFRQDFLFDFRKSCRKRPKNQPSVFRKQKILSQPHRKIGKYLFSLEIYPPARAPPPESDIKIHFRFPEVNHEQLL